MLKPEAVQKLIAALKEKIGKKVKLLVRLEVRDKELGNMGGYDDPRISGSEIEIEFLGVYGLGQNPLYIHGMDDKGKINVFRNASDVWVDENTSCSTHEDSTALIRIDDIDIDPWFKDRYVYGMEEMMFVGKVSAAEPGEKYLAEKILKGQPDYRPPCNMPHYCPHLFMLDDPKFVEMTIKHLDRIV